MSALFQAMKKFVAKSTEISKPLPEGHSQDQSVLAQVVNSDAQSDIFEECEPAEEDVNFEDQSEPKGETKPIEAHQHKHHFQCPPFSTQA